MNSRKAAIFLALLCTGIYGAEAKASKGHALGKSIRGKIGKAIDTQNSRFVQQKGKSQFLGDIAGSLAAGATSMAMGAATGMGGMGMNPMGGMGMNPTAGMPGQALPATNPDADADGNPRPDLGETETVQQKVEEQLEKTSKEGDKLEEAVDMLEKATGANDRKGVDFNIHVVDPKTSTQLKAEAAAEEAEVKTAAPPIYTAPVIVLLPPEPTPIEKLEFARAIACRGKMNTPEMKAVKTAELAEMATIKGNTVSTLQAELKATEALMETAKSDRNKLHEELRQVESNKAAGAKSEADVLFLKEDLKLADEKIAILLDKIKRLENRVHKLKKVEHEAKLNSKQ